MGSSAGNNEASEVLVSEAHDALDTDSDGKVTKEEFMTAHKERYNYLTTKENTTTFIT